MSVKNSINIRLKEGSHEAFYEVYHESNRKLFHFVRKFIYDTTIIDDIIHDSFLNLWNARQRIKPDYPIESYLFRITRNLVFKHLKAELKTAEAILELKSLQGKEEIEQSAEQFLITKEYENIYELAVDQLPPQRKKIFVLSREKGLSHKEIANSLEISPNTVKEHMSLAMKSIREYIAKEHDMILRSIVLLLASQIQ